MRRVVPKEGVRMRPTGEATPLEHVRYPMFTGVVYSGRSVHCQVLSRTSVSVSRASSEIVPGDGTGRWSD